MRRFALVSLIIAMGCGPQSASQTPGEDPTAEAPYELPTPELVAVAGGQLSIGDTVSVVGRDFVDPAHGKMAIRFEGIFTEEGGSRSTYAGELPIKYINPGTAEFVFGPNVIFSETGDQIGSFAGKATVVNRLSGGAEERSSGVMDVKMQVLPSIVVEYLRSVDAKCDSVTEATNPNNNLAFGVRAIGLGEADPANPITFTLQFASPALTATFVSNDYYKEAWYTTWPGQPTVSATSTRGPNTAVAAVTSGDSLYLDPSTRPQAFRISPAIRIGQNTYDDVTLHSLKTGALEGPGPATIRVLVEAERAGQTAARAVILNVYDPEEVLPYDGNVRKVERYAAEQVTGCISGGDIGRDYGYTEGKSDSRSRALSMRWDINNAATVGYSGSVSAGFSSTYFQFGANTSNTWSQTFGVDVNESVSSEMHQNSNLNAHILPSYFGTCYRQLERLERDVTLLYHNACGRSAVVGKATLTDWVWGFDIATGTSCAPPTNLPPPEKF